MMPLNKLLTEFGIIQNIDFASEQEKTILCVPFVKPFE